ncbi:HPr kinase/phosphorylase [Telmatospirillum sp. J64-1]|uniref:HPr kinase/phosphorylase n=1 Tax=Telmatospirillum sp. J64-1 TaxID=2502183 RepID=UPI00115F13E2|nr:HPr kinase/phosphatase C-terminal domain-containing protein [Telmatospirillum sp. J64-1]
MTRVHGSCVVIGEKAVLLRGPSGSGKSDLALRLIDDGARLVADDQTELTVLGGRLWAAPPATIAGMIEVRGLGILRLEHVERAELVLAVDLKPGGEIERLPAPQSVEWLGVDLPLVALDPFHPSAAAKLRLAMRVATRDIIVQT